MTVAFQRPPAVDLRPPGIPARVPGPAVMEIPGPDNKPKSLPPYSGAPPPMHYIPPQEASIPGAHPLYDPQWRQYPPSFDGHQPEPRRPSNAPALSSHSYHPMQSRELPQPPFSGPYGRPGSLPAPNPIHAPSEPPPPPANFHPMNNGASHESSPHSAPPEYRARMSMTPYEQPHTNGDPAPSQSLPPSQYPAAVPPVSHTPTPYETNYYQNPGMRPRRATRAQQACDQCRARKAKCDEGRPACSHCKENNLICVYKEVPPHKQEKSTQLVLDRIQGVHDLLEQKLRELQILYTTNENMLSQILYSGQDQKLVQYPRVKADATEFPQPSNPKKQALPDGAPNPGANNLQKQLIEAGGDGELSIPVEHTTAAHKLLRWESIMQLLKHRYDEDYVMQLEKGRGVIRPRGRGEGTSNTNYDLHTASPIASSSFDTRFNDAPTEKIGIDENGVMQINAETVHRYTKSYMDHIHKLHPFLDPLDLKGKTQLFAQMYCPKNPSHLNPGGSIGVPRGAKRKRSCDILQGPGGDSTQPGTDIRRPVESSVTNAIILLVLALGRICEVSDKPIRGPCTDQIIDYRTGPIPGPFGSAKSPAGLNSVYPQGSFPSVSDDQYIVLPDPPNLRNIDTIPGLVYYAHAANILGEFQGTTDLPYVQAALLAALYTGQLAHPFQSHGWILLAARACQVLIRPKYYAEMPEGNERDLLNFAYWTCLQLESDILAELDLPASGISRSEARIDLPNGRWTLTLPNDISAPSTMMMFLYLAQIHLRKVLNRVHTDLYKPDKRQEASSVQEILSMNLDLWRNSLPDKMRWKDSDPPSPDINVARMRAKYYGARYIIHRPILYYALHVLHLAPNEDSTAGSALSGSKSQQESPSQINSQRELRSYRDIPSKIRRACQVCVDSAIMSTEAFDGVKGRPVVTNIFGTAHAQFGNMLVLSATYMSYLSELVDRSILERLLRRTIAFLLQSRHISPSLRADAKILTDVYERIFGETPVIPVLA